MVVSSLRATWPRFVILRQTENRMRGLHFTFLALSGTIMLNVAWGNEYGFYSSLHLHKKGWNIPFKEMTITRLKRTNEYTPKSRQFSSGFSYCFGLENSRLVIDYGIAFSLGVRILVDSNNRWLHHNAAAVRGTTRTEAADKTSFWIKINRDHVGCLKTNCISVARTSFFEFRFKFAFTTSWARFVKIISYMFSWRLKTNIVGWKIIVILGSETSIKVSV